MTAPVSAAQKLACAERELKMREHVYPPRVTRGAMSSVLAKREIALMRAIVADYRALAAGERLL